MPFLFVLHRLRLIFPRSRTFHTPSSTPPIKFDNDTILATLSSYSNDWNRALEFFHWLSSTPGFSHSSATLTATVDILGKHFEFDRAWSLLSSFPSLPDRSTFRSLFNRLAAARLVSDALLALDRSAAFGLRDRQTFLQLIDALCAHRLTPEAYDLCFKNPPFSVNCDTKAHNLLLQGWLKMNWWGQCRRFWEDMDSRRVEKDLHSYTIYMDVVSKSGKPWKAIKLYKEMKNKGISPDAVAYNTVIQAAGHCDGAERAIRLYREMLDSGCKPTIATFNTIVNLLCSEGRVNEGYRFLGEMKKMGFEADVITYHCFFRHSSRPQEILWLFERMLATGCRPRMDTYVMLMKKFGRWGFLRPVFKVWKVMEEHGCSPDAFAYNVFIDALLQKGMVEMARKYDQEMLSKGLSPKLRKEFETKLVSGLSEDEDNNINSVNAANYEQVMPG
ncbi:pentatricopeptide repeat-containing protein At1g80550, mitochondrial [Dendrobium catenatum]|uniref:Pentatricopeptide repeat-containing protein n=1 Tax=Dendrobium catenatum TaxID=906689 RepID=A0A2I0XIV2_9ASPA|nr:pentatricopeptide repeat-containing protein At1g80550, mitochondrial [Dendrobium catenatum]PKU87828.1 Pentatricopeptide repeat-containing protein [Dendrobium catenatum]